MALTFADRMPWLKSENDEERWIRQSIAGDREAFGRLTEMHREELRSFLGRRLREPGLDDVLQDVWIAAWGALPSFDRRSRFKTWLYGIAINKYRDHCRKRARLDHEVPYSTSDVHAETRNDHSKTESEHYIGQILGDLSSEQREVVELYYCGELNLPEIARALGRNLNTVKYQFYRAHALLADTLREEGHFSEDNDRRNHATWM